VLMQASKNGFFYVIDRDTGKLISAEKFVKVNWAEGIDVKTGKPVETAYARDEPMRSRIWPGGDGAHSWAPMAFNPIVNLAYIPTLDSSRECNDSHVDVKGNYCYGAASLLAWDPIQQHAVWRVGLTGVRSGGTVTTAGNVVFQGRSDGKFVAYAADSGKELWSFNAQTGIAGAPITYTVGGHQFVSVLAGYGGGGAVADPRWDGRSQQRRLLTFTIGGGAELPSPRPRAEIIPVDDPQFKADLPFEKKGAENFAEHCTMCHGVDAIAGGQAPDLRASPIILSEKAFDEIVKRGVRRTAGMPRFEEVTEGDLGSIRQYLRSRARDLATDQSVTQSLMRAAKH
jgi:quinohemoprotein ethanol dehydrogenase